MAIPTMPLPIWTPAASTPKATVFPPRQERKKSRWGVLAFCKDQAFCGLSRRYSFQSLDLLPENTNDFTFIKQFPLTYLLNILSKTNKHTNNLAQCGGAHL